MTEKLKVIDGAFVREDSRFRNWVTADGSPGPSGEGGFRAEPDRYHLYISHACPWAHRTLIFRQLKGLMDIISVSVVYPISTDKSWEFREYPGATPDHLHGATFLYENYQRVDPHYQGLITVPVLWDKKQDTIVNNESSEIIRMLNSAFNAYADNDVDYYPEHLRDEINAINQPVYDNINNGVYRTGFATTQAAYEQAFDELFATLDMIEARLSKQRYLAGNQVTEADWRLFVTLVRFDAVYVGHFKCNKKRIADYPNLWGYVRELYQQPGIAATVYMDHIKNHYYLSHPGINPTGIVPRGPDIDFMQPHNRDRLHSK